MARFLRSKKESIGLPPDALFFRGEQKEDAVRLSVIDYNQDLIEENELTDIGECFPLDRNTETTTWLNIDGLHDFDVLLKLSEGLEIEPIIISNILDTHSRPTIHEYENCVYISLKMLRYEEGAHRATTENLVLLLRSNIMISFQERQGDVFNPVRERIRKGRKKIRTAGTDYLAFVLLDIVIDNYIYAISVLGDRIEALDDDLIRNPTSDKLHKINTYKMEINYLRKVIKPCREMMLNFAKLDAELIDDDMQVHLDELVNNISMANESVDSYREILSDQLNVFHSNVTNRLNDIMKVLTIFSVIFIPITFIAGVYGTNFDHIPELHFEYGYFMMWGVIIVVALAMLFYFRSRKWF